MPRSCNILGCLRLGFKFPRIEVSLDGVGCADPRSVAGALTAEDTTAGVGADMPCLILDALRTFPFVNGAFPSCRDCSEGASATCSEDVCCAFASISLVSWIMFFLLCARLGYAPGVSPLPTAPEAKISCRCRVLLPLPLTTSLSLSSLSVGLCPTGLCASFFSSSTLAGLLFGIFPP